MRVGPTSDRPDAPRAIEDLEGLTVVVVEDDPDSRELLAVVLRARGASVLTASAVDEGLALVRVGRPDIVISDIGMPNRDGCDLMRQLRALPPAEGGATPAIALSGFARPEDRSRSIAAGFQVHLTKPLDVEEVIATVLRVLTTARPSARPTEARASERVTAPTDVRVV